MGRITIRKHWKCVQAICTVASATCNSHVLLRRQRLIVEVVDGVAAETVSRQCRHRTWQGAVNVEQRVSVQMRSDAVVQASLGCEVEDAFERDDREHRAAGREGGRAGDVEAKRKAGRESGLSRTAAARRRHGHDDDAFISPTTSIPGRASVRDRIDRAKGMTVRQAIRLKFYTTRSLKRDETAGYIRLVRATGEGDPDTCMCDAEGDGLESDRSAMVSDTDVRNPVDDFSD